MSFSALIYLVLVSSLLVAQTTTHGNPKAIIEVGGTELHLGMTQAQVAAKLFGDEITKIKDDEWMLGSLSKGHMGPTLQFTNGVLSYAEREWTTSENDVGEALFGVISYLNTQGFSSCIVTADTKPSPDLTAQRVWISCGVKTVLLIRYSIGGHSYNSVEEQLGSMR